MKSLDDLLKAMAESGIQPQDSFLPCTLLQTGPWSFHLAVILQQWEITDSLQSLQLLKGNTATDI